MHLHSSTWQHCYPVRTLILCLILQVVEMLAQVRSQREVMHAVDVVDLTEERVMRPKADVADLMKTWVGHDGI